ncbi:VOC domain-containing protein OS=Streptomyces fumanus OX=67302 GN=GCM10018772_33210 PE=4 SV=1 [Streptomyces fumanus]
MLALGARVLDAEDREKKDFVVYADPAGHPFCLCRIEQG